ncbi:hypothetical protein HanXRQr2_Chr17g0800601 [Helianthus annuus]|uniref:Uncharacterized protein n=1 Tax=Helianthus annuus TaxID=4232 RepID=A0A9K3DH79_HELAN|nr:hypothetical protein HanXRQr2_Chr17g0800601 [Helianthus annuus]KAJ0812986.1 hypothetical protein HanPSC8_Chr17g0768241 [Helianthus annuus]
MKQQKTRQCIVTIPAGTNGVTGPNIFFSETLNMDKVSWKDVR